MPQTRTRKTTQTKAAQPKRAKATPAPVTEQQTPNSPSLVPLDSISLPASQPRRFFDPIKMEQLIQSVKTHGILENLLVRPLPEEGQ